MNTDYRVHGALDLTFVRAAQRTLMRVNQQRPPLQVVRAFDIADSAALVHLHLVSGGVLGGDRLDLAVQVCPEARVQLTTSSATRLYRSRDAAPDARQSNRITLHENSLLEYLPDSLIPFSGSRYRQETQITMREGSGLFWWEVIAPGREARGELFQYALLQLHTDIVAEGRLILRERARLEPALRPLASNARLGAYRYMATFYICKVGQNPAVWTALEAQLQEQMQAMTQVGQIVWGASSLPAHGLIVRALAVRGRDIFPGLVALWRAAKQTLYGREAILPRKIW